MFNSDVFNNLIETFCLGCVIGEDQDPIDIK